MILFNQNHNREFSPYENLVAHVLAYGVKKTDRTGTGTLSVFGPQMRFDLSESFPLVTSKRTPLKLVFAELDWILSGSTNNNDLRDRGCTIWDEWARENGDLGPIYGKQWRAWETTKIAPKADKDGHVWHFNETVDQIANVIDLIRKDPDGRRHIVSAWNVADLPHMALSPCHALFQFYVSEGRLSCQLYQRSADIFLGVPFNIASYALLTHMIAHVTGLQVGEFVWTGGDTHLYLNHIEQATELLTREPRPFPTLTIRDSVPASGNIDTFFFEDFQLVGYDPHPTIKAPVAI